MCFLCALELLFLLIVDYSSINISIFVFKPIIYIDFKRKILNAHCSKKCQFTVFFLIFHSAITIHIGIGKTNIWELYKFTNK